MGYFIGQLLGMALWSMPWAAVLRFGTRKVAKVELDFRTAYFTILTVYAVPFVCAIVLGVFLPDSSRAVIPLLTFVMAFFAACGIFGFRIRSVDGAPIGIWQGTKIALVLWTAQILFLAGIVGFVLLLARP